MKILLKIVLSLWLITCGLVAAAGVAVIGFYLLLADGYTVIYSLMPLVAITVHACLGRCIYLLFKGQLLGEKKI